VEQASRLLSSIQHRVSSIEHRASSIQHPSSDAALYVDHLEMLGIAPQDRVGDA
jgi:hypothetical protein